MKILIVTFLLSILFDDGQAQAFSIDEFAVMVPKLNMREKPTLNSRVLMTLEWGDLVHTTTMENQEMGACDTINNIYGCWLKVLHQNYSGYVFSPYLSGTYLLAYEESQMEVIPKYRYWYGIYSDEKKGTESIRRIKPRLDEDANNTEEHKHKLLKTNQAAKSIFIIATFDSIPEKEIGIYANNNRSLNKCSTYLRPGDTDYLYCSVKDHNITSEIYTLFTTGNFTFDGDQIVMSDQEIILVGTNQNGQKVVQNLRQYFGYKEVYKMLYTGDIDGDGRPDLIMGGSSSSGGATILFLSSRAKEGELLRPVAAIEDIDEC